MWVEKKKMSCGCETQLPVDGSEQLFKSSSLVDLMELASENYGYLPYFPISSFSGPFLFGCFSPLNLPFSVGTSGSVRGFILGII